MKKTGVLTHCQAIFKGWGRNGYKCIVLNWIYFLMMHSLLVLFIFYSLGVLLLFIWRIQISHPEYIWHRTARLKVDFCLGLEVIIMMYFSVTRWTEINVVIMFGAKLTKIILRPRWKLKLYQCFFQLNFNMLGPINKRKECYLKE